MLFYRSCQDQATSRAPTRSTMDEFLVKCLNYCNVHIHSFIPRSYSQVPEPLKSVHLVLSVQSAVVYFLHATPFEDVKSTIVTLQDTQGRHALLSRYREIP